VVFGKRTTGDVDLAALGDQGFRISGAPRTPLGLAVAGLGDFNGDGYADVAIAPNWFGFGRVPPTHVVYGSATPEDIDLADPQAPVLRILSDRTSYLGYFCGYALAGLGDVNGDRRPDLGIICTYGTTLSGPASTAYVIYGRRARGQIDLKFANRNHMKIIGRKLTDDWFDIAGAGDVNDDGYADVALSAQPSNTVFVIFGTRFNLPVNLNVPSGLRRGYRIVGGPDGPFALELAGAGDVLGDDGRSDLLVGSPAPNAQTGAAWLLPGRSTRRPVALADLSGAQRADGERPGDAAGSSVAAIGDFDGDGRPDAAIGATGAHLVYIVSLPFA
jgi:hypothetical protein